MYPDAPASKAPWMYSRLRRSVTKRINEFDALCLVPFVQALVHDNLHVYAAVKSATLGVVVCRVGMCGSIARWDQDAAHRDVLSLSEVFRDTRRTLFTEFLIELLRAGVGGVACDLNHVALDSSVRV